MKTTDVPRLSSEPASRPVVMTIGTAKFRPVHFTKLAVVYVRQSSVQQVLENRESTARQYGLVDLAQVLGWPSDRVLVIDEDQGMSGASAVHRQGFQRLLAEVTLDHVGLVLGLEMSRLARSSKDWHHLLEVCAVFGTLLGDQDGIYDPNDPNDRLLLGLKGTMSEVELHTMRNRLDRGRLNKARRGELFSHPPVGYVVLPTGQLVKDPDVQAQSTIQMFFEKFTELGSARSLFRWFRQHQVQLPFRPHSGPLKGEIDWRLPGVSIVHQILHHPFYAGAYTFGRRRENPKLGKSAGNHPRKKWMPMEEWEVLIQDHLPAYITWEQYLQNLERLHRNQNLSETPGIPRSGAALMSGVVECGGCGWRMHALYRHPRRPLYHCVSYQDSADPAHQRRVSAKLIDALIVRQVLLALEPAALQLSLQAQSDLQRERDRLDQHWQQQRQRAQYDADLAGRRYRAVDPDNRLVASTLEQQWESALREQSRIEEEYHRFCQQTPAFLTPDEESHILALACTIPVLWNAPETTNADRQAILRCVIDKVVVHMDRSERGHLIIYWKGGFESRLQFERGVRVYEQLHDYDRLRERVMALREAGISCQAAAELLNVEGFQTCRSGLRFNKNSVRSLMRKDGDLDELRRSDLLQADEWLVVTLAEKLGMPADQLRYWAMRGWINSRRSPVRKLWILWVDADERRRLERLRDSPTHGMHGYPAELITPKDRPSPETNDR